MSSNNDSKDINDSGDSNDSTSTAANTVIVTRADQVIFVTLVLFSLVGVGITNISPLDAHNYWIAMLFVFASATIYCGRKRAHARGETLEGLFLKHVIHWFGALIAVLCVYTLLHTGRLNQDDVGLVMLLILALATFLAGIHVGWRFYVLGALLALTTVVAAYIEEFMWIILLIATAIVSATFYFRKKDKGTK